MRQRIRSMRRQWRSMRLLVRRRPASELSRSHRKVRFVLDMVRLAAIRLRRNKAGFMAAALSYRVLFSLIPLLALGALIARYSVSDAAFLDAVDDFINQLGLDSVNVASLQGSDGHAGLGDWLRAQAKAAMAINPASLGVVGGVVLVWSCYKLFDEVERVCSTLTGGLRRRTLRARMVLAVTLLVAIPVLATYGLSMLSDVLATLPGGSGVVVVLGSTVHVLLIGVVLTGIICTAYHWIPLDGPTWRASMIGAVSAAVALMAGEWGLRAYVLSAVPSSPVGGALGLVPLIMLWVYVMWLCLLYGLELAVLVDRGRRRWQSLSRG
ncbi:MAG: YihY/virulence factor BrkB family protein [Phycisphaerales bacterium]|nr:YihY/virulence factor BrkB family protein [Phycisphaerales bacterium]